MIRDSSVQQWIDICQGLPMPNLKGLSDLNNNVKQRLPKRIRKRFLSRGLGVPNVIFVTLSRPNVVRTLKSRPEKHQKGELIKDKAKK